MASVTQLVPTLTGGVSQQPDELKVPGQVNVANNVLPDVTHGLLKRPGGKLVASLSDGTNNSTANGRWFHYYRDEDEQYVGQVSRAGDINMWKCSDGSEMTVTGATTAMTNYLTHSNDEDIQTLTINDFTFLTNRTKTVAMANTIEPLRPPEIFVELKTIKYAAQYSLNLFDSTATTPISTATRISIDLVRSSNNYCTSDGHMDTHANRPNNSTRCDDDAGPGSDDLGPNVGTRIFEITSGATLVDNDAVGGTLDASGDPSSDTSYSYLANIYGKLFGGTYTQSGTTVTVSSNGHGLSTNDEVYFDFLAGAGVDTTKQITVVDGDTFTFTADASATQSSAENVNYALNLSLIHI